MSQRMDFDKLLESKNVSRDALAAAWSEVKINPKEGLAVKMEASLLIATEHRNITAIEWLTHQWQIQRSGPHEKLHFANLIDRAKLKGFTEIEEYFHRVHALVHLSYVKKVIKPNHIFTARELASSTANDLGAGVKKLTK